MRIAFIGNQGGERAFGFYSAMARTMIESYEPIKVLFGVWLEREKAALNRDGWPEESIYTFESWVKSNPPAEKELDRICDEYREVNWSEVIACERNFTDYSQLLGGVGHRTESAEYVNRLLLNIVTFFETLFSRDKVEAVVCQTADTLFTLVVFKVAAHFGVKVFAITPAWVLEPGCEGGFFSNNEFVESLRMIENYNQVRHRGLTESEIRRVDDLMRSIRGFTGKTAFYSKNKGSNAGMTAISPNVSRLLKYLQANAQKDKNVEYIKIDPWNKLRANLLRAWRKSWGRRWLGTPDTGSIPSKSIFYAIHYQPEQSTLAQGIYYVNQVALIENISKSLPLGYTLVVKEHPWGRGTRPVWQYRHIAGFYNVMFCDAPSKKIISNVEAVIAVTGTIAVESMVLDKPTIVLGRSFFTHADLLYRVREIQYLPEVLKRVLIDGDYAAIPNRGERLSKFLISYFEAIIPYFPTIENARHYGHALAQELKLNAKAMGHH